MGGKYYQLKFILILFMSILAFFILYIAKNQSFSSPDLIFALIGILVMVMGNYFKVIQPNYFLGIRTPWTLENKEVWKTTHVFASKLWVIGGMLVVFCTMIFPKDINVVISVSVFGVIVIVPIVYSYIKFKEIEKR
jgi:uncharacterized membrane protein